MVELRPGSGGGGLRDALPDLRHDPVRRGSDRSRLRPALQTRHNVGPGSRRSSAGDPPSTHRGALDTVPLQHGQGIGHGDARTPTSRTRECVTASRTVSGAPGDAEGLDDDVHDPVNHVRQSASQRQGDAVRAVSTRYSPPRRAQVCPTRPSASLGAEPLVIAVDGRGRRECGQTREGVRTSGARARRPASVAGARPNSRGRHRRAARGTRPTPPPNAAHRWPWRWGAAQARVPPRLTCRALPA